MDVLIFIAVIVALIVVHEFGHFVAAKWARMRVDEFGIGYPPRALTIAKIGDTAYTLNWLPFGGFVKIYGEDGNEKGSRAFSSRSRVLQAIVLLAGVTMNIVFAYVLIVAALVSGMPRALSPSELPSAKEVTLAVAAVMPGTPAATSGLVPGDFIREASDVRGAWQPSDPSSFTSFIAASRGEEIVLVVDRNGAERTIPIRPEQGVVASDPQRYALGVEIAPVGVVAVPFTEAVTAGARITWGATKLTAQGLWHFFSGVFTFSADLSQVAGPVGIAGAVGAASSQGFGDLLSLMAIISINLALINLIPVPALDGGRLLFVIIESITRKPIQARVAYSMNAIGFAFLILLMVVITAHDIFRIVG